MTIGKIVGKLFSAGTKNVKPMANIAKVSQVGLRTPIIRTAAQVTKEPMPLKELNRLLTEFEKSQNGQAAMSLEDLNKLLNYVIR